MTKLNLPPILSKLEDMTRAAVAHQAKLWCDALRGGKAWDNGDAFQGAFVGAIQDRVRKGVTPADIDTLEKHMIDLTFSEKPIDDYEEKNPHSLYNPADGVIPSWRKDIRTDYHPSGVLRAALKLMGAEGKEPSAGGKLEMMIPCKSDTEINTVGVVASFGYGSPKTGSWSTLREVDPNEYDVTHRYLQFGRDRSRYDLPWKGEPDFKKSDLVWVQLHRGTAVPTVQMFRVTGYVRAGYPFYADDEGNLRDIESSIAYDCSRVANEGYLGLAVRR